MCTDGGPSQAGGSLLTAGASDDTWLLSVTHFVLQGPRKADVAVFLVVCTFAVSGMSTAVRP